MSSVRRTSTWTNRGKIKVNHDGIAALNFGRTSASIFHLLNILIFDSKGSVSVVCVCDVTHDLMLMRFGSLMEVLLNLRPQQLHIKFRLTKKLNP